MPTLDFQSSVALLIALGAATYLSRRSYLALLGQTKPGCGSCNSCPTAEKPLLVKIDSSPLGK